MTVLKICGIHIAIDPSLKGEPPLGTMAQHIPTEVKHQQKQEALALAIARLVPKSEMEKAMLLATVERARKRLRATEQGNSTQ